MNINEDGERDGGFCCIRGFGQLKMHSWCIIYASITATPTPLYTNQHIGAHQPLCSNTCAYLCTQTGWGSVEDVGNCSIHLERWLEAGKKTSKGTWMGRLQTRFCSSATQPFQSVEESTCKRLVTKTVTDSRDSGILGKHIHRTVSNFLIVFHFD